MKEQVIQLVMECLMQETGRTDLQKDSIIYGSDGLFDSMGIINFIVLLEKKLGDTYHTAVALVDEKAFSPAESPFRSVDSLVEHLEVKLRNAL